MFFDIFKKAKPAKKQTRYDIFIEDCRKTILAYEGDEIITCVDDLVEEITRQTAGAKEGINDGLLPISEYEILINKLIANCTFDLLVSGKYHIYTGILNPLCCGLALLKVREKSLKFALDNGHISAEELAKDNEYLSKRMLVVG